MVKQCTLAELTAGPLFISRDDLKSLHPSFKGGQGLTQSANEEYLDEVAVQNHLLDLITTIVEEGLYLREARLRYSRGTSSIREGM